VDKVKIIEQYNFYMLADTDMNRALNTLKTIRRYKKKDVINALIRDIIVIYSKPFTNCKGTHIARHRLDKDEFVPISLHALHEKIMKYRNQIFAHTDLTARKPRLGRLQVGSGYRYGIAFRGFSPSDFEKDLPRIEETIRKVKEKISTKLRDIEKKLDLIE
jgi:hypothetical protein